MAACLIHLCNDGAYQRCSAQFYLKGIAGASIWACRNVNRHIVALEEDKAIFNALLKPLICAPVMVPSM